MAIESGLSWNIQYEVLICANCSHAEHRAADLDAVAALAAGDLRGVRLVEFPPDAQPSDDHGELDASLGDSVPATGPRSGKIPAPDRELDIVPPTLRDLSPPLPIHAGESPAPGPTPVPVNVNRTPRRAQDAGSGRTLTLLLVISGLSVAAWLLFGRGEPSDPTLPVGTASLPSPSTNTWDNSAPFVCPENGDIRLVDRTIHVERGTAISIEDHCRLTLIRCNVKAPIAIDMRGATEPHLTMEDSRIEGTVLALRPSYSSTVEARRSHVLGLIPMEEGQRPLLRGITAVPVTDIPGAPHAVDPAALVGMARAVSGLGERGVLAQIDGIFVGSNGRVDFDAPAYKGRVRYRFELPPGSPIEEVRPAGVPLGIPVSKNPDPARRLIRTVTADVEGIRLDKASSNGVIVVSLDVPPHCSFQQIWEAAIAGAAPANALAHVLYNSDSKGQGWWFHIDDTQFTFSIGADTCKR